MIISRSAYFRAAVFLMIAMASGACDEGTGVGTAGELDLKAHVLPAVNPPGATIVVIVVGKNNTDRTIYIRPYCPLFRFEVRDSEDRRVFRKSDEPCGYIGEYPDTALAPGEDVWAAMTYWTVTDSGPDGTGEPLPPGIYRVLPVTQPEPGSTEWVQKGLGDHFTLEQR